MKKITICICLIFAAISVQKASAQTGSTAPYAPFAGALKRDDPNKNQSYPTTRDPRVNQSQEAPYGNSGGKVQSNDTRNPREVGYTPNPPVGYDGKTQPSANSSYEAGRNVYGNTGYQSIGEQRNATPQSISTQTKKPNNR